MDETGTALIAATSFNINPPTEDELASLIDFSAADGSEYELLVGSSTNVTTTEPGSLSTGELFLSSEAFVLYTEERIVEENLAALGEAVHKELIKGMHMRLSVN